MCSIWDGLGGILTLMYFMKRKSEMDAIIFLYTLTCEDVTFNAFKLHCLQKI